MGMVSAAMSVPLWAQSAPPPASNTPSTPEPSAAQRFPFPGEQPAAPATNPPQPAVPDSGGYSSSKDTGPDAAPELHDLGPGGQTQQVDVERAAKDKQVAAFYERDWNYHGAYLRYKDAVLYSPNDADAHFGLAEMARKLNKKDEALREYEAYLKLEPKGHRAHEAEKALEDMAAPGGH